MSSNISNSIIRRGAWLDLSELVVWWGWDLARLGGVYHSGSVKEETTWIMWKLPGKSGQGWKTRFEELGQEDGWRKFPRQGTGTEMRRDWMIFSKENGAGLRDLGLCDLLDREIWARENVSQVPKNEVWGRSRNMKKIAWTLYKYSTLSLGKARRRAGKLCWYVSNLKQSFKK